MLYLNLIHRPEAYVDGMLETYRFQVDAAHACGLKATNLISFQGMQDARVVDIVKAGWEKHGDEPGIHFHSYQCDAFRKEIPVRERAFWGNTQENQRRIIDLLVSRFEKLFGFLPTSLGSYYFDAAALAHIRSTYPGVKCVIASCFNEGSICSRGTNNNWYFYNEGGPWWPWYPARNHVLRPARSEADSAGLVAIPHLCRDMLMSINDRNDYFASHPGNILRGKAWEGPQSTYDVNMIEQFAAQDRYNAGYAYYTMFVSLPWLMFDYEDPEGTVQTMYRKELEHMARMKAEGRLSDLTMSEFAAWFRANRPIGTQDVCYWQDILCGSGREAFWTITGAYRACLDSALGSAVCDLRPYAGALDGATGADTPQLWNGSYPFMVNAHKRGSSMPKFDRASIFGTVVSDGKSRANLSSQRAAMKAYDPATRRLLIEPVTVKLGAGRATVQQSFVFGDQGIRLETTVLGLEGLDNVTVSHYLSGCVGHTEYPEDIRDVTMGIAGAGGERQMKVAYLAEEVAMDNPRRLWAKVPGLGTVAELEAVSAADRGEISDEFLFSPYFNLVLSSTVSAGGGLASCLNLKKL